MTESAIDYAKEQLGVKYVFGGEQPGVEFDCSGLVQYSYRKAGIQLPRTAAQQQKATTQISAKNAKPGDLVFFGNPATHVGIYLGNDEFLEAPHTGSVVKIAHFNEGAVTFGRVTGSDAATGRAAAVANAQDPSTYQSYGYVASLANLVPDIKAKLDQAIKEGWSVDKFNDEIDTTNWWKQNSDTAKKYIALQAADPAEFNQELNNAKSHVMNLANSLGVALSASVVQQYATQDLFQGMDDNSLNALIASRYQPTQLKPGQGGLSVQLTQQAQQLVGEYGVPVTGAWISGQVKQALVDGTGVEGIQKALSNMAASAFPSLAAQLQAGQTTQDIAQPYIASMSQLLEVDPSTITLKDPTIQKALSGQLPSSTPAPTSKTGVTPPAAPTTLYDFQSAVKNDPRWDTTTNAKTAAFQMSHDLLKSFGATAI